MPYLVLIETAGNQPYIFGSNRLRENIGASELISRIGREFVVQAVAKACGETSQYKSLADRLGDGQEPLAPSEFARQLTDIAENSPLDSDGVEIVVATSGKAVLLVADREWGKTIIGNVTKRALTKAPGAVVRGVVSANSINLSGDISQAHAAVKEVHKTFEQLRLDLPPPEARFPMLPILRPCRSSGLPATGYRKSELGYPIALPFIVKEENRDAGVARMKAAVGGKDGEALASSIAELEEMKVDWLGIVHADGNGFGGLFKNFNEVCGANDARGYFCAYREFALSLELCGIAAFRGALAAVQARTAKRSTNKTKELPIVPLVLGGDDLTVICDGREAIDFAVDYLRAFEAATEELDLDGFKSNIPNITKRNGTKLGAAAGVAIVKPHFPFHRAYELADKLLRSAKRTNQIFARTVNGDLRTCNSVSTIDFQAIYEDASADLTLLRERWTVDNGNTRLWLRPYLVSTPERVDQATKEASAGAKAAAWAKHHQFSGFQDAVNALVRVNTSTGRDSRGLPRGQQHALRSALFLGKKTAKARLKLIEHRYERPVEWNKIKRGEELFFPDVAYDKGQWTDCNATVFLDALEYIDIARPLAKAGP